MRSRWRWWMFIERERFIEQWFDVCRLIFARFIERWTMFVELMMFIERDEMIVWDKSWWWKRFSWFIQKKEFFCCLLLDQKNRFFWCAFQIFQWCSFEKFLTKLKKRRGLLLIQRLKRCFELNRSDWFRFWLMWWWSREWKWEWNDSFRLFFFFWMINIRQLFFFWNDWFFQHWSFENWSS